MANKIQLKRGLKANLPALSAGEPGYTTDTRELYIGTGSGNVNMGGSHWYRGTTLSGTVTTTGYYSYAACPEVKVDDIYLNTSNGNVYACTTAGSGTTAKWTYQGSIKGAKGDTGATGAVAPGPTWTNTTVNEWTSSEDIVVPYLRVEGNFDFQSNGYTSIDEVTAALNDLISRVAALEG